MRDGQWGLVNGAGCADTPHQAPAGRSDLFGFAGVIVGAVDLGLVEAYPARRLIAARAVSGY
jgi:hypothetical protein